MIIFENDTTWIVKSSDNASLHFIYIIKLETNDAIIIF